MRCNKCKKRVDSKALVCGHCGESLFEQKKKNNIIQIIILIIGVFIAICLNRILFSTTLISESTETKETTTSTVTTTKTNPVDSKDDNVRLLKQDGEYKKYELKLDNFSGYGIFRFNVEGHEIMVDFNAEDRYGFTEIKKYIDNVFIFDDYSEILEEIKRFKEPETYLMDVHVFGDYLIMDNSQISSYKDGVLYIFDSKSRTVKKLSILDPRGLTLSDYSDEEAFDSTGITLKGDISSLGSFGVNLPGDLYGIPLCNKSEWPEWFDENYIYSATFKYEFKDGILDLNGKIIESKTVGEEVKEDEENGYCDYE